MRFLRYCAIIAITKLISQLLASHVEDSAIPVVQEISPSRGSYNGGTPVRVTVDNIDPNTIKYCLFWCNEASAIAGISTDLIEMVPISRYISEKEVVCTSSPSKKKFQDAHLLLVGNEDIAFYEAMLQSRGKMFHYYDENYVSSAKLESLRTNGKAIISIRTIHPMFGPAEQAGTRVHVHGENFVNTTSLRCRFDSVVVPATFVSSSEAYCHSPPIRNTNQTWLLLPEQRHKYTSNQLFPSSHHHPQFSGRLVSFEMSNNARDFTDAGLMFLYQRDIKVVSISRSEGPSRGGTPVFISGSSFVNNTDLSCRFGNRATKAHFLTRESILCFSPPIPGKSYRNTNKEKSFPVLVSNNAMDYSYAGEFIYTSFIPQGMYQAGVEGHHMMHCLPGSYCSEVLETNLTLCSPGTYQPSLSQSRCLLCPIGFVCFGFGLSAPILCPAGYVCDEKGMALAKLCPPGFWCDKGTATFDTECFNSDVLTSDVMKSDTSFSNIGSCFDNSTDDFGLQASQHPAVFWSERHLMPLDSDKTIQPTRGKYCLEDSCLKLEDSNNVEVFDEFFDYSATGVVLRRPHACPAGLYCNAGTATDVASTEAAAPKVCGNTFHCPEGSSDPKGIGVCMPGFYCRFGIKKACPVGTYCPDDNAFDPLPCEPGTFNFMIGQAECTICPLGGYCPSYGLKDPVICPPGFVCSKMGLSKPNIRCPAGFYCQNGTQTSDPFRNDTTLRPLACSPGTYCLAGTGYDEVREDTVALPSSGGYTALYAQPCPSGFFCEAASISAKGSGPCPPGFICPKSTANPRPTPKGSFAEHIGTIEATACLPGFYAPTIENEKCYTCPAGTSCTVEGLWEAEECPPGTYRSTTEVDGNGCVSCPQGTWSKNWQLREKGECTRCPTGVTCPLDGMTTPCSFFDLPTPYEPIVNFRGMPAFEYDFPLESMPPRYSMDECLALNSASNEFFYGELIPPFIDVLGRGPHFRQSDNQSLKYQIEAKCYKNSQPSGSLLYQRMADYYGPRFDIQFGYPHQGYGSTALLNQMIATAPPKGYDFGLRYGYFRGRGHGYIDLPKARTFDSSFNCTKGFRLFNSTLITETTQRIVYTNPFNDYEGGYDIEKCSTWDAELSCFVDSRFEVHAEGECCNIEKYQQRAIFFADDQFYEGTCEADKICSEGRSAEPQAKECDDGFVCDEATTLENSLDHPCPAGFICGFATTPDTNLISPAGQLNLLCKKGHYCKGGTGTKEDIPSCPANYFCPTGTADPYTGQLANDSMLRLLMLPESHFSMQYQEGDTFSMLRGGNDSICNAATHASLQRRFNLSPHDYSNINHIEYLSKSGDARSFPVKESTRYDMHCDRDHKSFFVKDAMKRRECNCRNQFFVLAAVYRLWKCTSLEPLDNFSFANPNSLQGKRDYWYPDSRIHQDRDTAIRMDPSVEIFGSNWGSGQQCTFEDSSSQIGLTRGKLPISDDGFLNFDAKAFRFDIQFTHVEQKAFDSYSELKQRVTIEYLNEKDHFDQRLRSDIDPFIFDLHRAILLIEKYGEKLEDIIELQPTEGMLSNEYFFRGPVDWCECQNLLKCPNGTVSERATDIYGCISTKNEVLNRITLLPDNATSPEVFSTAEGTVDVSHTLDLDPYEVAVLTIDQSELPSNFSYGEHYQFSIYNGCKPCPLRYQCGKSSTETSCEYPSKAMQIHHVNQCLKENRKPVCILPGGSYEDVESCRSAVNTTNENTILKPLIFTEPDIELCLSRPYMCVDNEWNFRTFRRLCQDTFSNGKKSAVYDCADVHRWQIYARWRDGICCSSPRVPELRGIDSCFNDSVCADDPIIGELIREKMISLFETEYGFIPPIEEPLGQLLWDSVQQEQAEHDSPLDLFNEWKEPFDSTRYSEYGELYNKHNPKKADWLYSSDCCKCQRHRMPYSIDTNTISSGFADDKHRFIQITISALAKITLTVVIELLHGYYYADFIDYFGSIDKSVLRVHTPSRFGGHAHDKATVLSIMEKSIFTKLHLDLPLNLPINLIDGRNEIESSFLIDRSSNISIGDHAFVKSHLNVSGDNRIKDESRTQFALPREPIDLVRVEDDWFSHEFWAVPYIPFFSNCDGYGSHISWSRLLEEHPDCLSVDYDEVIPINEMSFRNAPHMNNDACDEVFLRCTFEEDIEEARENLRWYEAPPGSTLFYITRNAVASTFFSPSSKEEDWGRTHLLNQLRNSYDIIPMLVDKEMSGYRHAIPRHVELELKYFQVTHGSKRLVEAKLYYGDFCTTENARTGSSNILNAMKERGIEPCEVDINGVMKSRNYNLEVSYSPLNWLDLLNRFEFKVSVYFLLYTAMGLIVCAMGGFVYGTNRLVTKLRHPPKFQCLTLIKLVTRPQLEGCTLALVPYITMISIIYSLFGRNNVTAFGFDSVHSTWADTGLISSTQIIDNSIGRLGSSLLVLGFWIIHKGLQNFIPNQETPFAQGDKGKQNDSTSDITSKRSHFITISLCVQGAMLCFLEFSYSEHFKNRIYSFVVLFRICAFCFDLVMSNMIQEKLLMAPLMVLIQMTEMLITIGARDFLEFSLAFFIKVAMLIILRLVIYPLMKTIGTLWPRWRMLLDQAISSKGLTRQQKKDREATWKKINEEIELRTEGVEPLLDAISIYSIDKIGNMMVPFMCLMLMYLYPETEIASQYGINQHELLYYGIFALYMIPFISFVDAFILSSQELIYGWRVYDYFSYQRWRFANREHRWNLFAQVDESVTKPLQSIDVLCFSSQYYFILTILTLGFGTNMFGVTICLRRQYSFLGDPVFPVIAVMMVMCCEALYAVCTLIADSTVDAISWDGIWKVRQLQGTMDDIVAAKLAIGEGRQEDLERERQEFLAMNSETFRHKFMEKNRPWVLQHLVELITPRTLQDPEATGPDGRPLADYVRDTYSNLMTVGEGVKRSGERSDISSDDSSDDEFEHRRTWDRTPLDGNKLLIAQIWLQKARKRRVFSSAVSAIITKRKADHCSVCSRTLSSCSALTAGLMWDGKFDPNAIDGMIAEFENKYSSTESDVLLWKAFFRETAEFATICNICLDGVEQKKLNKDVRHVGAGRPTRPGDISSDDESEDEMLDPVILVRSSKEGQIMSKWLRVSRLRLGGKFPKHGAEQQTKAYLDRLQRKKTEAKRPRNTTITAEREAPKYETNVSNSSAAMIRKWLNDAKKMSKTRYDNRAEEIRVELQNTLEQMNSPEDDWIFEELRLDGKSLKIEGNQLIKEKKKNDELASKQLQAFKLNLDEQIQMFKQKQNARREDLDQSLARTKNESKVRIDKRDVELNRTIDERPGEEELLRGQHYLEMTREDELLANKERELRQEAEKYIAALEREIQYANRKHELDSQTITERIRQEYISVENNWRVRVNTWLGKANKKLEAKAAFDRDKAGVPALTAKKARLNQRKKTIVSKSEVGEATGNSATDAGDT